MPRVASDKDAQAAHNEKTQALRAKDKAAAIKRRKALEAMPDSELKTKPGDLLFVCRLVRRRT